MATTEVIITDKRKVSFGKKFLTILAMILPTSVYIVVWQIILPMFSNESSFATVYEVESDNIVFENTKETYTLKMVAPYEKGSSTYYEITGAKNCLVTFGGETVTLKYEKTEFKVSEIELNSNSILIKAKKGATTTFVAEYEEQQVVAEKITNPIRITIGMALGIVVIVLLTRSKIKEWDKTLATMLTLAIVTIIVMLLQTILTEMLWVMLSADLGYLVALLIDKFTPDDLFNKAFRQRQKDKKANKKSETYKKIGNV